MKQSSCCSTEARDDIPHLQATTESLSDVLMTVASRRNIHHRPALLWRFCDSDTGYKTTYLLTYLQVEPFWHEAPERLVFLYVNTVSSKVVRHSLACLTVHKQLVGDAPLNINFATKSVIPGCRNNVMCIPFASQQLQCNVKFITTPIN